MSTAEKAVSYVIPSTLLQLDQPPSPSIRILNIFRRSCDPEGISDKLHPILHTSSELIRLGLAVNMNFLRSAADDEDRYPSRFKHAGREYVHVPYIEYATIRFQAGSSVLPGQGGVDLVLRSGEPQLEGLGVAFDVSVEDFRKNVFAHFAKEGLDLE